MPSAKVKVSEVAHTTITSASGMDLNYVVLKGYDDTNSKGFSKRFFATKKDGSPTKNAEIADGLQPNDWVDVVMDDSSYHNVQTIKKISEPAGGSAPDQTSYKAAGSSNPSGAGSSKGGARSGDQLNRATALEAAVKCVTSSDNGGSADTVIDLAFKFEQFIIYGAAKPTMTYDQSGGETTKPEPDPNLEDVDGPSDDDIPF